MPRLVEIVCQVISIKYQSKDSDWVKLGIRHDSEQKVAVGNFDAAELRLRQDYRMHGWWEHHPVYGEQFKFSSMVISEPVSFHGVLAYLQQAKHMGLARATKLWEAFQGEAVRILRTDPQSVAQVLGVPLHTATEWAAFFQERQSEEILDQQLMALLSGHGFQFKNLKEKLLERWGLAAADQIKRDPFHMLGMPSAGFARCDALYMALNKNPHRLKRQALCAHNLLMRDMSGHTWVDQTVAENNIWKKVGGTSIRTAKAIELAQRAGLIERWEDRPGHWMVADAKRAKWERRIAEKLHELMQAQPKWTEWLGDSALDRLYDSQAPQVLHALNTYPVFLLVGPPGTGKSFVLAEIIRSLKRLRLHSIGVCAPTGKAAVRATEMLNAAGIPLRANTIHSTLDVSHNDGEYHFHHCDKDPLPVDVLIIDEISMVDASLLGQCLDACKQGTHIIMIGDQHQLEPVGHGAPLRDMLAAGVPTVHLTEIHRFAGTIERCCSSIINTGQLVLDDAIDISVKPPHNLKLIHVDAIYMERKIREMFEGIKRIGQHDPVWDTQLMVAVNKGSPIARRSMNLMLQNLLNPDGYRVPENPFRVGDKVICLKNAFMSGPDAGYTHYVANGELGRIVEVFPRRSVAEFGGRLVVVPHGKLSLEDTENGEEQEKVSIDLGYAVTTHKMQGSQTPIAIVALDEYAGATGPYGVCNRQWLYTAISRAQEICFLVGKPVTALQMLGKSGLQARRTRLAEYLGAYSQEASHDPQLAVRNG
jgi:exodeoxyribonuclease V alpha subunit